MALFFFCFYGFSFFTCTSLIAFADLNGFTYVFLLLYDMVVFLVFSFDGMLFDCWFHFSILLMSIVILICLKMLAEAVLSDRRMV